jgi:hypothetical protein
LVHSENAARARNHPIADVFRASEPSLGAVLSSTNEAAAAQLRRAIHASDVKDIKNYIGE